MIVAMKKKIITIAGKLGSGKSTTAKRIIQELGYTHFSSGDFLRNVAESHGMTIKELILAAEKDPQIDVHIDQVVKDKGNEEDLVIDSRLAFHWIPESFKVYLDIHPDNAAERMFKDLESNEGRKRSENSSTLEDMKKNMIERHESDVRRYMKLYGINHTDHNHFDLVIDTGKEENNLDSVVQQIIDGYQRHLEK